MPSSIHALRGERNPANFPSARHVVIILVDGLGAMLLRARAGHARTLATALGPATTIDAGFPSTTASALTTLMTGTTPGVHGIVGYRVRDDAGRITNQLRGWDHLMIPSKWQRSRTLFDEALSEGIRVSSVLDPAYLGSGFSEAILHGATFYGARTIAERCEVVRRLTREPGPGLTYLYISELDQAGHRYGSESDAWVAQLEELEACVVRLVRNVPADCGVVLTADHGMIDISSDRHVLYDTSPELLAGVQAVGGEPRFLHLYTSPQSDPATVAARWCESEGERAWVATRDEALAAGWFGGDIDPVVRPRIGDVLVAARKRIAYYDSRDASNAGREMVGQHGSLTQDELRVPLLRFSAFG